LHASKLDDEEVLALESDDRVLVTDTNPALAARTEAIEKELTLRKNDMQTNFIKIVLCLYPFRKVLLDISHCEKNDKNPKIINSA
jgi:hypothetical protein